MEAKEENEEEDEVIKNEINIEEEKQDGLQDTNSDL